MTLFDDLGEDVPLRGVPRRVVSLVPSLTEAIETTMPGVVAGATEYCTHPEHLDVPRVGGSKYPRVDRIVELRPDLVLANSEENRLEDVEHLRANGFSVWVTEAPSTVPHALASLRRLLAQAFEADEPEWLVQAEDLWRETPPVRRHAVVPVWRKPWVILGRDTFAGDVLRRLGVSIVYGEHEDRYPRPKLEEMLSWFASDQADLLVLPDEPYEFTAADGPEAFPGVGYALVSGRYLTWYGPSLVAAHRELRRAL
ncbi:helical backbone metal receptor [Amycolatopsis alkalitolerans]|uniref:Cobalamin-binding protein n=1 Tax=Amycolatopsis alkalitolerans TaxID=2547244 RepID=A0A5C4LUZ0_9PSEU|nr:helical backbone metal receptor [Amycolatopsis alkalitolerans]TNC23138.1 cobalamin-binding protein [Amycolatopsis alkalitolerans]